MSLMCKLRLPCGGIEDLEVRNIHQEQVEFFMDKCLTVTLEQHYSHTYSLYSTTGVFWDDGDDIEVVVISNEKKGETCEEAFTKLQHKVEVVLLEEENTK